MEFSRSATRVPPVSRHSWSRTHGWWFPLAGWLTLGAVWLPRPASAAPEAESPKQSASEIAAVRLTADRLPKGWTITKEMEAKSEQFPPFEERLGAKITGIVSQLLESKAGKIQLNYVSFLIPDEMARAYRLMQQRARGALTVVAVGRVTIEIGATSEELKALATGWLPLHKVQSLKVKQHQVAGKWLLTDETLLTENDRKRLTAEHGVNLADGLTQFFRTKSGEGVRIDLYEPTEDSGVERLQGALLRAGDLRNKLVPLSGCLAQIITNDDRTRAEAERLLKENAQSVAKERPTPAPAGE